MKKTKRKKKLTPRINPAFTDALELKVGLTYTLTRKTPLMPKRRVEDINLDENCEPMKQLWGDETIKILEVDTAGRGTWYRAKATAENGDEIGEGWIYAIALMGQNLKEKKEGNHGSSTS